MTVPIQKFAMKIIGNLPIGNKRGVIYNIFIYLHIFKYPFNTIQTSYSRNNEIAVSTVLDAQLTLNFLSVTQTKLSKNLCKNSFAVHLLLTSYINNYCCLEPCQEALKCPYVVPTRGSDTEQCLWYTRALQPISGTFLQ